MKLDQMWLHKTILLLITATFVGLTACSGSQPATDSAVNDEPASAETGLPPLGNPPDTAIEQQGLEPSNEANIEAVEIMILESFPVQVNVVVRGFLPDSCATIEQISQGQEADTYAIAVSTMHQTGVMCTEQEEPFEEIVPLDVVGLPAGTYTVTATGANSVSNTFALAVDNVPPQTSSAPEAVGASIDGIVWEDSCNIAEDGAVAAGCIEDDSGGYQADGVFNNDEGRITGVEVTLRGGQCPGGDDILGTSTTDASGTYLFTGLAAGDYCVLIDTASEANTALLLPGSWTYPDTKSGSTAVTLTADDYQTIDFGWDYQLEAVADPNEGIACDDAAGYVADVTIPDDTQLAPGESFVKTWRVRNEGACTWGPGYSMIFTGGNQMNAADSVPIQQLVQPGEEVELSIDMAAPTGVGTHRGEWKFENSDGTVFGSRGDFPLYLQIVVIDE